MKAELKQITSKEQLESLPSGTWLLFDELHFDEFRSCETGHVYSEGIAFHISGTGKFVNRLFSEYEFNWEGSPARVGLLKNGSPTHHAYHVYEIILKRIKGE